MSLLGPYADVADYRDRVNKASSDDDAELLQQLTGASRLLERKLGIAPGGFNQSEASTTRTFAGQGKPKLYLLDEQGQHLLQSVDANGIAVDEDGDGVCETTFSLSEAWVQPYPRNAAETEEPYDALELLPFTSNTTLDCWPAGPVSVRITGLWGWPDVPSMIRELTVKLARDTRDSLEAGAEGDVHYLDSDIAVRGDTFRLWRNVERAYGYGGQIPRVA